jgi:tetratricopeptide (TPR) repeat protein
MTKNDIITYLNQPHLINEEQTSNLLSLKNEYPYCHTFHLLHLKGLKNTNSIEFEKYLPLASLNASNREVLYHLIIKNDLRNKIESIEQEMSEATLVETPVVETITDYAQTEETQITTKEEVINEVEQLILEELSQAQYHIEEIAQPKQQIEAEKPVEETLPTSMSFTGWLNPTGSKQKKATGMDLIEKFIQENPTISKAKADTYTAPNIAKMSVVDNDDLVTETLARVYMKQGHYDKAITTYEKLSLKIPEKKAFFASQIEVIEELKKQK